MRFLRSIRHGRDSSVGMMADIEQCSLLFIMGTIAHPVVRALRVDSW